MEKADVAADVAADVSVVSESTQNATYKSSYKFEKTNNSMATNYKKSLISGSNDFMKNPLHKISAPTDMATKLNPPFEASFKLPTGFFLNFMFSGPKCQIWGKISFSGVALARFRAKRTI